MNRATTATTADDDARTSGRSETTKAAPARPLVDRAAPNASPRTKKIAAQSRAPLGKKELKAVVLEMGTAMGWWQDGCEGSEDTTPTFIGKIVNCSSARL